jgi:hypothetical protein
VSRMDVITESGGENRISDELNNMSVT